MPHFLHLPPEVLDNVFQHLVSGDSVTTLLSDGCDPIVVTSHRATRSTLRNLCQTNKYLAALASCHLYRNILVENDKSLFCLFRTFACRPELRDPVRSFAWTGKVDPAKTDINLANDLGVQNWPATSYDKSLKCSLAFSVQEICAPSILACLLGMMPTLQALFLAADCIPTRTNPWSPELNGLHRVLLASRRLGQRYLQKLEFIAIEPFHGDQYFWSRWANNDQPALLDQGHAGTNMVQVLNKALAVCPRLRKLHFKDHENIFGQRRGEGGRIASPQALQELVLLHSYNPIRTIRHIAHACPKLTSLKIEFSGKQAPVRDSLNETRLIHGLTLLADTLETLSLTRRNLASRSPPDWETTPLLPALKQMHVLKHLSIDIEWLCEERKDLLPLASSLPCSLVSLRLADGWKSLQGTLDNTARFFALVLQSIYGELPDALPNLKDLALDLVVRIDLITSAKTEMERMAVVWTDSSFLFRNLGVSLHGPTLVKGHRDPETWAQTLCM